MKTRTLLIILLIAVSYQPVFAQRKSKLNTNGQGTLFAQVGLNRSVYSNSNVELSGNNYNVILNETSIQDNLEGEKLGAFFSSKSPQINIKLGYFVKPKWAITIGFDRYNTFFEDNQEVTLEGNFAPGENSTYSGAVNEEVLLTRNQFNIAQTSGVNFFSVGIQRNDLLTRTRKSEFALQTIYGVQVGPLLTQVEYTYDGYTSPGISSLSGFGAAANIGVRFEFIQHIFLQLELDGGILNQNQIKLSDNGATEGKQVVGFISPSVQLGFNVFARPKNNCGTCPKW
ncbi:hypothetical protein [Brumimicrobium mesophilum]|uniref:hypothetical protein n=1 Tax=Brumimicrobium mesophilum TaxID=392717 RepID=UPI000D1432DA|nr:hypothetical protein [Brumimicrobium mesophilum]